MQKGFGIAALVFSILAVFVPVVTVYVVLLAMILAAVAGFFGDRTFTIASVAISVVNIVFLSPVTWAALAGESLQGGSVLKWVIIIMLVAPIIAMVVGHAARRKPGPASQTAV